MLSGSRNPSFVPPGSPSATSYRLMPRFPSTQLKQAHTRGTVLEDRMTAHLEATVCQELLQTLSI